MNKVFIDIEIKEVLNAKDRKEFAKLPFYIYKNNKFWVPNLIKDDIKNIDKSQNPAFEQCEAKFWLAYKNNKCVGRIGAIINYEYNKKVNEKIGRFSRAEFIDDKEVSSKLFATAEDWLKIKGMTRILGPLGFNNFDNQGLLVEGFDYLPSIASTYHLPYYKEHIENSGYEKEIDWLEFRLTISDIPENALRLNEVIKKRYNVRVLNLTSKNEVNKYANEVFDLLNIAFDEIPFVSPFTEKLKEYYIKKYFSFLNPKFIKIIVNDENKVIGFVIAMPSLSKAMQKAAGKLLPFGFFHILKALKKPEYMDLILTGIDPKLQGQGISALLITELQKEFLAFNIKYVETTGMFETNHKAIQHWKNYEHIQHKRRRCYTKKILLI